MNKSEREMLANIVSEMIYGFESNSQLLSTGQQILSSFPSIAEDVEKYRYPVAASNVVSCIRSAAMSLHDSTLLSAENKELNRTTFDSVEDIFDAYLENFKDDAFYAHLYDLEERLANADTRLAVSIVSELFESNLWRTAVVDVYGVSTAEFNYLTNTK